MAKLNTDESIVDYLKSQGEDSSFSARKTLATEMGITNYVGSDAQNIQMLNTLKNNTATTTTATTQKNTNVSNGNKGKAADKKVEENTSKIKGSTEELDAKRNQTFTVSDSVNDAKTDMTSGKETLNTLVNKENIIDPSIMSSLNSSFSTPSAVKEADAYLSNQLKLIQSGKTSYSDQLKDMMDKIMNREKFSYDVDTDPLFQQALASAMNSGKQAMTDTIGQASALTGGYGSTYATSAGNQSYNAFIEDAYNNLPQYYQMALEAYQMEGDEMYRQFGMVSELDDKEFNRNVTAYDATYQHRNRMYDEAYNSYRDSKSDALAMANLQLSEHGQRVNDAYNYYNVASDTYSTLYNQEYNAWADSIDLAYRETELRNNDYWNQTNFDEGVRQYEQSFAEDVRQFDATYAQNEDHFTRGQEFQASEAEKNRTWQSSEAEKDRAFTASENAKNRSVKTSYVSGSGSTLTPTEMKEVEKKYTTNGGGMKGLEAVDSYLTSIGKNGMSEEENNALKTSLGNLTIPSYYQEWNMYDANGNLLDGADDTNNGGWFFGTNLFGAGEDHNDMYTNGITSMSFDDLKKAINDSDLSAEEKKKKIDALKKQSKK